MWKLAFLCCLLAVPTMAAGQSDDAQPGRQRVEFNCQCSDSVGQLVATALRDLLASSPRYVEYSPQIPAPKDAPFYWQIKAISIDPTENNTGRNTSISIVFLGSEVYYLSQMVQTCGVNKADDCARSILAGLDSALNSR